MSPNLYQIQLVSTYTIINSILYKMGQIATCFFLSSIITRKVVIDGLHLRIPVHPQQFISEVSSSRFIPCNYNQEKEFKSKYYSDEMMDLDADYFILKAVEVIRQAKSVLDELQIPFWLSSGTCLG